MFREMDSNPGRPSRVLHAAAAAAVLGMLWAPGAAWTQTPEESPTAAAQTESEDFQASDAKASAANAEAEKKDGKAEPSERRHRQPVRPIVGEDSTVKVKEGEDLYKFARHHEFGVEHVAWANGLPTELSTADRAELVLPERRVLPANPPEDGIVVNLPERGLYYFQDGKLADFYPVTIGQNGRFETPTGDFQVLDLSINPEWRVPKWAKDKYKDEIVKPGEDNPLGDRWIGLTTDGLGIHSTMSPMYIGDAVSHGCVRMYPPHARELFDKLEEGVPVRIEYEPVKLGRDESGNYFLAVFPDVYQELDMKAEIQRTLEAAGLAPLQDEDLAKLLEQPTGLAERLDVPVAQRESEGSDTVAMTEPADAPQEGWLSGLLSRIGFLDFFRGGDSAATETATGVESEADPAAAGEFTRLHEDDADLEASEDR